MIGFYRLTKIACPYNEILMMMLDIVVTYCADIALHALVAGHA
jgi:hypothetical protein